MMTTSTPMPPIASRSEWESARAELLVWEKELMRMKDAVSAALPMLLAFRERMGWKLPWVSSAGSTFNDDFGATVDGEERHSVSVFLRDGDRVFHTWQTFNRGEEPFMVVFDLLDLTPYGRQETWEDAAAAGSCGHRM